MSFIMVACEIFPWFRIKEVLEAKYHLPVMALNDGKRQP